MLIVLSFFFLVVWLIFFKWKWLPWSRGWKVTVYTTALGIALVVVGALQYSCGQKTHSPFDFNILALSMLLCLASMEAYNWLNNSSRRWGFL